MAKENAKQIDPTRRLASWLQIAVQVGSLILIGALIWTHKERIWGQLTGGNPYLIGVAFLLIGTVTVLSATRIRVLANAFIEANGPFVSWRRYYYLNTGTRAAALFIPRSLSTIGGKSVGLRTLGFPLARSLWIVFLDNAFDLGLLGLLVIPSLLAIQGTLNWTGLAVVTILLVAGLALAVWEIEDIEWLETEFKKLLHHPWIQKHVRVDPEAAPSLLPDRRSALTALGLTIALNLILGVQYWVIAQAVGVAEPIGLFLAGFPVTQLSLILAMTPGGIGVFDASWYGVLRLGGLSNQDALAFVVAQRAYIFVFVLIWAGVSALLSMTERSR